MEKILIWTASNAVNDTTRRVNPAPDGCHCDRVELGYLGYSRW